MQTADLDLETQSETNIIVGPSAWGLCLAAVFAIAALFYATAWWQAPNSSFNETDSLAWAAWIKIYVNNCNNVWRSFFNLPAVGHCWHRTNHFLRPRDGRHSGARTVSFLLENHHEENLTRSFAGLLTVAHSAS